MICGYTTIVQIRKLAEILPFESADLYYNLAESKTPNFIIGSHSDYRCYNPCWSLTALLSVLPEYHLSSPNPLEKQCCCRVKDIETYSNNPIDTCVEMILNLHKLNLL